MVESMERNGRVGLPEETEQRLRYLAGYAGLAWCALFGWFSVIHGGDVPVLWFIQLAVHEAGHRVFAPFGEYTMILMGSGSEILLPFAIGVGCLVWPRKRNLIAAGMCWALAAGAIVHTAWYVADAPRGEGELIGGGESDWLVILDEYWDTLFKADVYAARLRLAAWVVWLAAVGLVVAGMIVAKRRSEPATASTSAVASAAPSRPLTEVSDGQMWR
jgi:hypothetical protein